MHLFRRKVYLTALFTILSVSLSATPVFANNDRPSGASRLSLNQRKSGVLSRTDTVDWWRLQLEEIGKLKCSLHMPEGDDFDFEIHNQNAPNGLLDDSTKSSGFDEEILIFPNVSDNPYLKYYLKVYSDGSNSGGYEIVCGQQPNHPPMIANTVVSPSAGNRLTSFVYFVTYTDSDGDPPDVKVVKIDGTDHEMSYVSGEYTTGALFKYETRLALGKHIYSFHFSDGGEAVGAVFSGPSVVNDPPRINIATPTAGATVSGTITISVEAFDPEDGAVSKVEYYIDDYPLPRHIDPFPRPQGGTSSQWNWDTTGYSDGRHRIRVRAYDRDGSASDMSIEVTLSRERLPTLSNPSVTPATGNKNTTFSFSVIYTDPEGEAPKEALLTLRNGNSYPMSRVSGNYSSGARYQYEVKLPVGNHSFLFEFKDPQNHLVSTQSFNGPTITNQNPTVNITAPIADAILKGMVTISVSASDPEDLGVSRVEYYIDGIPRHTDSSPLSQSGVVSQWNWDTAAASEGPHWVAVKVYDRDSGFSKQEIRVTVTRNFPPTLSEVSFDPSSGTKDTYFTFYVTYKDPEGESPQQSLLTLNTSGPTYAMSRVSGNYSTGARYKVRTKLPAGSHQFSFEFKDQYGNRAQAQVFTGPTVTNQKPSVAIASPGSNTTLASSVTISVDADDPEDGAVSKVEYLIDGVLQYTDFSPKSQSRGASQWAWDTRTVSEGAHRIRVRAYDRDGAFADAEIEIAVARSGVQVDGPVGTIDVGERVEFNGLLLGNQGQRTRIYISSPEASIVTSVLTSSDGSFSYRWTPRDAGTFYFQFGLTNQTSLGDAFKIVSVIPGVARITSVDFTPSSGATVGPGSNFDVRVRVGLETSVKGVLQVWVGGNGVSQEEWVSVSASSQSKVIELRLRMKAPSQPGSFLYNVYTQFQPATSRGPLWTTTDYDIVQTDIYGIETGPPGTMTRAVEIPTGYSTFGLPFNLNNISIASAFPNGAPRYILAWDAQTSSYQIAPKVEGYKNFSTLKSGEGYLTYSDRNTQVSFSGIPLPQITIPLKAGWNMVSQPTAVEHLPILGATISKDGNSYSLVEAAAQGIIRDGIYQLRDGRWELARFLKSGKGYFIYTMVPCDLIINVFEGPYLTSLDQDSFSGYVPARGTMPFVISVPDGATKLQIGVGGSEAVGVSLFLYDPTGRLYQSAVSSKEITIRSPKEGRWNLEIRSSVQTDVHIEGSVLIEHPEGGQYASLAMQKPDSGRPARMNAFFGVLGYGDLTGGVGMAADLGVNVVGFVPLPHAAIADDVVDLVQLTSALAAPVIVPYLTGEPIEFEDWINRVWPNAVALVPYVGDSIQGTRKVKLAASVKFADNVFKKVDDLVKVLKKGRLMLILREGESIDNLPPYLKAIYQDGKMRSLRGLKFPSDEITKMISGGDNTIKGFVAAKVVKGHAKIVGATGVMPEYIGDANKVRNQLIAQKLLRNSEIPGKELGLPSYNPLEWSAPTERVFVRLSDGKTIKEVNQGNDLIFIHEGTLYFSEVKSIKDAGWRKSIFDDDMIGQLKAIQRTFDTEMPEWKGKTKVIVHSLDETPSWVIQKFKEAGIPLIMREGPSLP